MKIKSIWSNLNKITFFTCLIISIGLLIASFVIPPPGAIHPSVLQGCAILMGYATLSAVIHSINKGSDVTFKKGDMEVTLNNPDDNNDENNN